MDGSRLKYTKVRNRLLDKYTDFVGHVRCVLHTCTKWGLADGHSILRLRFSYQHLNLDTDQLDNYKVMAIIARVYLVRHGETDANRSGIIQGQMDTALNDRGVQQAGDVGEALRSIPFDRAYSSDLVRASKTAELILKHHPSLRVEKQEMLRERFMGDLQGQPVQSKTKWVATRVEPESPTTFVNRTLSWWNKTILKGIASLPLSADPYHILVTTHGGVIGTMVRNLIQSGQVSCAPDVVIWFCGNTSITIVDVTEDGLGIITKYGDVSHIRKGEEERLETNADEVQIK